MKSIDEVLAALAECSRHADILHHARSGLGNTRFTLDAPALKAAALNPFLDGIDDLLEVWKQVSGYAKEQGRHTRSAGPTMRLTDQQIDSIRHIVREAAGPAARTRVFGSRLRDDVSGGDLDLLVELPDPVAAPAELAARLSARISPSLHGRSVDVLLLAPNLRRLPIYEVALGEGHMLCASSPCGIATSPCD